MDNLTLEMRACEKAGFGVSYGKWKATQPVRVRPVVRVEEAVEPEDFKYQKVCAWCSKEFGSNRADAMYCSNNCCALASYHRRKGRKANEAEEAGHD